ncbi:MAG TPA: M48 family metalloprotease [Burkholderiaceae bacterium]|nr:M48 family metalloprotease [Burkholderiaceae bacterium]
MAAAATIAFVPMAARAIDTPACVTSPIRAQQVAASDSAMVATLQAALGEVAVPESVKLIFARLTAANSAEPARDYKLLGYRGPAFTAHAAAPGVVLVSDRLWTEAGRSESDIAAVLAHELAHLQLAHSHIAGCRALKFVDSEEWDIGAAVQAVLKVAKKEPSVAQAWNTMQQRFEFEADALGLTFLRRAGYDPRALPRLLRRLSERSDSAERDAQTTASTHPALQRRIEAAERHLTRDH